jgi:hypothetical protein
MQNALIVPVKVLREKKDSRVPITSIAFHVNQPWLISNGSNNDVILWT